jgi:uncharacterized repeat protein (TIGR01451 family)
MKRTIALLGVLGVASVAAPALAQVTSANVVFQERCDGTSNLAVTYSPAPEQGQGSVVTINLLVDGELFQTFTDETDVQGGDLSGFHADIFGLPVDQDFTYSVEVFYAATPEADPVSVPVTFGPPSDGIVEGCAPPAEPGVSLEKDTNGVDADDPPGPFIPVGDPVSWTYVVTNTGNVALSDIEVTDDQGVVVTCPDDFELEPGEDGTCTADGEAVSGQYENLGTVTAADPFGTDVTASDLSHYAGVSPGIDIEKSTNGLDADIVGPIIPVGDPVTWEYVVTNTGNDPIGDVAVTDNQGLVPEFVDGDTNGDDLLDVDETWTYEAPGTADPGFYENVGSVEGEDTVLGTTVQDSDASHYFGSVAEIDIEKATNGVDADDPPGPLIPVGNPVSWTYVVTNTGNVRLTDIEVTDDQGIAVNCREDALGRGDDMTCTGSGTSTFGQYENNATATGEDLAGTPVSDDDSSHYFGARAEIRIEKYTNGRDADEPRGPRIPVGDRVVWTYEVTNPGDVPIQDIVVSDNRRGVSPEFVGGDEDADEELDPGETWTYRATGRAKPGQHKNRGTATGIGVLETELRDGDPSHYFGAGKPRIVINKSASKRRVRPGDVFGYRIKVRNKGDVAARNVVVCDPLPKYQHLLGTNPRADRSSDREACWRLRRLGAGNSRTFRVTVQVDESSPPGKQKNVAVAKGKRDGATVAVVSQGGSCRTLRAPLGVFEPTADARARPRRC